MKSSVLFFLALFLTATPLVAQTNPPAGQEQFIALPIAQQHGPVYTISTLIDDRAPFLVGALPIAEGGSAQVNVGGTIDHIFLLGMTDKNSPKMQNRRGPSELIRPATAIDAWTDPRDQSVRFFVGDDMGRIRLNYADGTTQVFPLRLGESIWWGRVFYDYPEPYYGTDATLRNAFETAIRLYPPWPLADGNYVAVIKTKPVPLLSITFENNPAKKGTLAINGITVECTDTNGIGGFTFGSPITGSSGFAKFIKKKSLLPLGEDVPQTERHLRNLRMALYSSDATFKGPVSPEIPPGYAGPMVSFQGNLSAEVLANAFYANVQDILNKIDDTGMYHTSTSNALSWGGYKGFGTFRKNLGRYYDVSYVRDMGRSLQEVTMLGFTNATLRCADYCLAKARLWETEPSLRIKGQPVPPHWSMFANRPDRGSYENDGQGLTTLFIYKVWQWLPDRDTWLRDHWPEIRGEGDWILWQFAHPEISGATNGLLRTTGESAANGGHSVYPDCICMDALRALAQMADSIGETNSAQQWRDRAGQMQQAISANYIIDDPKYGRVWTLDHAGWPNKSTVLGPLIFLADYQGFAPEDEMDDWHSLNEAAYQRLADVFPPFGFYGQAMGYGQGFMTQSVLLLDRMHDATTMLDWTAKEIYDPRFNQFDHYIVPEGVQISPDGRYWYRIGDLGNGVQEAEIVKALRLVIGVDDTRPNRLQFYPRLPYGWSEMTVEKYPVVFEDAGKMETTFLRYKLQRTRRGMKLEISADQDLGTVAMRLGPFEKQPEISDVRVNGQTPAGATIEQSGDSWWVKCVMPIGLAPSK
jgi:hypothetical protein